ncbi:hypothetical protein ACFOEE_17110 [Pseudoalteromonas fenneropenaei]|uniref:Uncharacterized protein n=1 Tax=Pseudoalteromonas fenneropenaei TaxID=1737459 RepID=A0ABV7CNH3_9GAMM
MVKVNIHLEQLEELLEERQYQDRRKQQLPILPEQDRRKRVRRRSEAVSFAQVQSGA